MIAFIPTMMAPLIAPREKMLQAVNR